MTDEIGEPSHAREWRWPEDFEINVKCTVYGYLRAIRQLADFCQKSPDQLLEQDVRKYLLHLIVELKVATGTQTVALSGIRFFFRTTCLRDWKILSQTKLRYIDSLPEVITRQQVQQIIDACRTLRLQTFLRHRRTKGSGSRDASLAMMFKLAKSAEKKWRRLNGHQKIIPLLQGIKFTNGMIQDAA